MRERPPPLSFIAVFTWVYGVGDWEAPVHQATVGWMPYICLPTAIGSQWCAGNLLPRLNLLPHFLAVDRGRDEVTSGTEVGGDWPIGGEEALRVACRLEAPHGPLTLAVGAREQQAPYLGTASIAAHAWCEYRERHT